MPAPTRLPIRPPKPRYTARTSALQRLLLACTSLLLVGSAQAHQIWFEPEGQHLTFRYGELDVNMHEVSPGGLDRFGQLTATWQTSAGDRPLALSKRTDRFTVPAVAGPGESFVAIDLSYPMFDTTREGKPLRTFWVPATRWVSDFSARQPTLPLDIVPTGVVKGTTVQFRIVFKGEPLAGVKLSLVVPSGWTRQATSDINGLFSVPLPWRGTYVLGTYYVDEVEGQRQGEQGSEPYQLQGYNTALSFRQVRGAAPFPVTDKTLPASVLAALAKAKAAAAAASK